MKQCRSHGLQGSEVYLAIHGCAAFVAMLLSMTCSHIGNAESKHLMRRGHHCNGCAKGAGAATGGAEPVSGQPWKGLAASSVRPYESCVHAKNFLVESKVMAFGKVLQSSGLQPCCSQLQIHVAQAAWILRSKAAPV